MEPVLTGTVSLDDTAVELNTIQKKPNKSKPELGESRAFKKGKNKAESKKKITLGFAMDKEDKEFNEGTNFLKSNKLQGQDINNKKV